MLVILVLIFFLVSVRAALIAALTIPLALLFAFIFLHATRRSRQPALHRRHRFRHHHRRHHRDGRKHLSRTRPASRPEYNLHEVILHAARDVDRPIFYSVAVIIAGYLPIYALTGPSGKLFRPMANTMAFALLGALVFTLTFVPVIVSLWFKGPSKKNRNTSTNGFATLCAKLLGWCLDHPKVTVIASLLIFGARRSCFRCIGGEFLPHLDEGALWVRATMPYTIAFEEAAKFAPQVRDDADQISAGHRRRLGTRPAR